VKLVKFSCSRIKIGLQYMPLIFRYGGIKSYLSLQFSRLYLPFHNPWHRIRAFCLIFFQER
jgi:hypothetical protein